jgi:amidohydrolase
MNVEKIKRLAVDMREKTVETRRYLHTHPELSWRETETSLYVERRLREYGYENIRRGFGDAASGVTADLSGSRGPRVALRADLDALPIHEETTRRTVHRPTASCTPADTTGTYRSCWPLRKYCP